jgi:putative amide transporter protein
LTAYTGWVTAIEGFLTAAIPAFLILTGYWADWNQAAIAVTLGVFGVAMALALLPLTHPRLHMGVPTQAATGRT